MDTKDLNNNLDDKECVENVKSVDEHEAKLQQTLGSENINNISFELSNLSICEDQIQSPAVKIKSKVCKLPTINEQPKQQPQLSAKLEVVKSIDLTVSANESKKRKRFDDKFRDTFKDIEVIHDVKKIKTDPTKLKTIWEDESANINEIDIVTTKTVLSKIVQLKAEKSTTYRTHTAKQKQVTERAKFAVFPEEKKKSQPVKVQKLPDLIKRLIIHEPETRYWSSKRTTMQYNMIYPVYRGCEEYDMIADYFTAYDNQNDYVITHVERIENPTLMAAFVMKRQELIDMKPRLSVTTDMLFHCTRFDATESIIKENFDWRFAGASRGHKYGHGTCFSPHSDFATQFGKPRKGNLYYTLLCHVVARKTIIGTAEMVIPDAQFDTSRSKDGKVIVKYHDNTAYPAYRITYRKCEKYHDDINMQRNDWYHNQHHSSNYHRYNQNYSQFNFAQDISFNHLNGVYAFNSRAPSTNAHHFNFSYKHHNYHNDDRDHRHHQQQSKKGNKGKNKRYMPY